MIFKKYQGCYSLVAVYTSASAIFYSLWLSLMLSFVQGKSAQEDFLSSHSDAVDLVVDHFDAAQSNRPHGSFDDLNLI